MTATPYSPLEELCHAVSHGIGAILSVVGLILMLQLALPTDDSRYFISSLVYGCSLILLYSSSTFYHAVSHLGVKHKLRQLDHAAIFILIAGTYTPFTLINLRDSWGLPLFILIWTIALTGVFIELATNLKHKKLSLALYLETIIPASCYLASVCTGRQYMPFSFCVFLCAQLIKRPDNAGLLS